MGYHCLAIYQYLNKWYEDFIAKQNVLFLDDFFKFLITCVDLCLTVLYFINYLILHVIQRMPTYVQAMVMKCKDIL